MNIYTQQRVQVCCMWGGGQRDCYGLSFPESKMQRNWNYAQCVYTGKERVAAEDGAIKDKVQVWWLFSG